jgi:hypothetical protein
LQMLQPEGRSAGSKPAYAPNVHKGSLQHLLCTYLLHPYPIFYSCNLHIILFI